MVFGSLPIAEMRAEGPKLSVVIPCLNEAARLPLLLADLQRWPLPIAITVVDGGSSDASHRITILAGGQWVPAHPPGRGRQLVLGGRHAIQQNKQGWILFLHADSRLPRRWASSVLTRIQNDDAHHFAWFFDLRIDPPTPARRGLEALIALRSRWFQRPYGDQGLLIHTSLYERSGGFAPLPLMEDLDLVERLSQLTRLRALGLSVTTDGRQWQQSGVLHRSIKNAWLRQRWRRGESPTLLMEDYYGKSTDSS